MLAYWEVKESGFSNMWETKFQRLKVPLRQAKQWAQALTRKLMEELSSMWCRSAGLDRITRLYPLMVQEPLQLIIKQT